MVPSAASSSNDVAADRRVRSVRQQCALAAAVSHAKPLGDSSSGASRDELGAILRLTPRSRLPAIDVSHVTRRLWKIVRAVARNTGAPNQQ